MKSWFARLLRLQENINGKSQVNQISGKPSFNGSSTIDNDDILVILTIQWPYLYALRTVRSSSRIINNYSTYFRLGRGVFIYKYLAHRYDSFPFHLPAKMRQILVLVLVLSILGINHVTCQRNNWLAGLALGGVAGWAAGNYINRNRRQDALNDYLLYRSFAPRPYYWGNPWSMGRGFCKSLSLLLSLSYFFNSRIYKVMYIHFLPLKLLQSVRADFNELNYFIDYD